jgi:hypothetical protein
MLWSSLDRVEHKQLVVRGRRTKESIEVYQDLGGERGGAGGVVDSQPVITRENEGIGT